MDALLTRVTAFEPAMALSKAMPHITAKSFHFNLTLNAYWQAAIIVPLIAGIFVVPSNVAKGYCGKVTISAGVCTRPPPPTIASIKPAPKAAMHNIIISVVIAA